MKELKTLVVSLFDLRDDLVSPRPRFGVLVFRPIETVDVIKVMHCQKLNVTSWLIFRVGEPISSRPLPTWNPLEIGRVFLFQ